MENKVLMYYDVEEGSYYYKKPFVEYKGGKLFVEGQVEVKDEDVESYLRAVREYKRPEGTQENHYHRVLTNKEVTKKIDNAYDYWFLDFTHQAMGGGLILWWHIQEVWESELARRGEHKCPKCGTKTVMYYEPFCPNCGEIEKQKGAVNFFQLAYHLAHKSEEYDNRDYYDAAMESNYEAWGNDRAVSLQLHDGAHPCLVEMNEAYNFNDHLFWVSW